MCSNVQPIASTSASVLTLHTLAYSGLQRHGMPAIQPSRAAAGQTVEEVRGLPLLPLHGDDSCHNS
jgi:hypothetical protein